jgi:hypothetical protein
LGSTVAGRLPIDGFVSSTHIASPADAPRRSEESAPAEKRVPQLGEVLGQVEERFDLEHSLGVLVVDAKPLAAIEEKYGNDAHQRVLASLAVEIHAAIGGHLSVDDLVVAGETGRSEAVVVLFRSHDEGNFYSGELPSLRRAIWDRLEARGNRIVYPFLRSAPELFVGIAPAIRNPTLGPVTQLRRAIDEARDDARLETRIASRKRREGFVKLILEGQVTSVYEPIVEVATRTVFGYEALARGPEGTDLHSPLAMFGGAEEQGPAPAGGHQAVPEHAPHHDPRPELPARSAVPHAGAHPALEQRPRVRDLRAGLDRELLDVPRGARLLRQHGLPDRTR